MNAVVLGDVCKNFGKVHAVDHLNVTVPAGAIYGFLGPNGAGKTTTIRMIMNIIRPDSGHVSLFEGRSVEQAKSRIGYMPEERGLYRKMTVRSVLAYFGAIKGVANKELAQRVTEWLERVELAKWADKKVEELSRGMHQKLQFAVTAINNPDLFILDEPFSGLDPINTDLLKKIILDMRQQGKTIIFSTHVMHEAEKLCEFILLVNKGKVLLDDRLDQIRSRQTSDIVSVELEGETDFIEGLPNVLKVTSEGKRLDIKLAPDADPQELLRAFMDRVRVQAFEVKVPSLHEIFVDLVGKSDAEAA
ncbi:MAG: ATP-binding cassette domain-containing protein [Sedimentisphaerales bacterium]|nr:ATP-binding cassette domain-containing protein [Sedimentisphaerales bacterium]